MKGELRLGFMMHAAQSIIPALARRYSEARPDVRLILDERIPTDIDEMLMEGGLDAAVTFGSDYAPHLQTVNLARERLRLIVPTGHPLAGAGTIGPKQLRNERLIAAPATVVPALRSAITVYFAASGIVPHFAFEPRLQHTIIRLVAEGLGVALIPESLCGELGTGLSSRPLVKSPELNVVLCAPVASKNPAVSQLMELGRAMHLQRK
jgi:DNA-binding transcriptional LysR family regulator